ncbi:MAG: hypothetical protein FJ297_16295 [Planctomycetes bacterium]|nr:hypothetical protein [Planctomycetota bacterium]
MKNWIIVLAVVATAVAFSGRVVATRSSADHELADAEAAALRGGYCGNAWNATNYVPCDGGTVNCPDGVHYCSESSFNVMVPNGPGNLKPNIPSTRTRYCQICGHNCGSVQDVQLTVPCGT